MASSPLRGDADAIEELVQKMSCLQQAVVDERASKEQLEKRVETAQEELASTRHSLREKELIAVRLYKQREEMQDKLDQFVSEFKGKVGRGENPSTDTAILEIENRLLKKQKQQLEDEIADSERSKDSLRDQNVEKLRTHIEEQEKVTGERIAALEKENEELKAKATSLARKYEEADEERKEWKEKFEILDHKTSPDTFMNLQSRIAELENELAASKADGLKMADKLVEYKAKFETLQLTLRKFSVKRHTMEGRIEPYSISVVKNPSTGRFYLEVESSETHRSTLHDMAEVAHVRQVREDLCGITTITGHEDMYETRELEEFISFLREIMRLVSESDSATQILANTAILKSQMV